MSLVATLISNPVDPQLDTTVIDAASAALPSPSQAEWLFNEVAADIRFSSTEDIRTISDRLRAAL
ncbi:MAG: phosphoserine phosphatase SerB, partial [Bradyrhizobium sp.]|nr:phosphoserine phosphatase SerB [Bradyrhizobium sp.]